MTRITNAMITNTTLMHINRNMRQLDEIIRQIETTKRIQRPSDDPIIASRALKFRTSVHENEQFMRNVNNGVAWMNVTESTFTNINDQLLAEMRNLLVRGANQDNNISEMRTYITQMQSLFNEITNAVNHKYAGQYLFSGFRTDEPPVFAQGNDRSFIITQHFSLADISRQRTFQRLPGVSHPDLIEPVVHDINVLKLAFNRIDGPPEIPGFHVVPFSVTHEDAYRPPEDPYNGLPVIHFIEETGELVMHDTTAANFPREGVSVTFQKTGFREGDINPAVYFTSREIVSQTPVIPQGTQLIYSVTQYFSSAASVPANTVPHPETGAGTFFRFELAHDEVFTDPNAPALDPRLPVGAFFYEGPPAAVYIPANLFQTESNISVTYSVEITGATAAADALALKTDLSVQGVSIVRALDASGRPVRLETVEYNRSFDMHNQDFQLEFATNTLVTINSLAKNVLTDKMFGDFRRFFEFADALVISDENDIRQFFQTEHGLEGEELERAVRDHIDNNEYAPARSAMYNMFNNMLFRIDRHIDNSTREQTLLGSRMVRLELLQNRLESDEVTYNRLVSDNENTDMIHALILRASAEAAFMSSLRANSGIVQMSLADFIR